VGRGGRPSPRIGGFETHRRDAAWLGGSIVLDQVSMLYTGHPLVNPISLMIPDGELFVRLEGSGSEERTAMQARRHPLPTRR